MVKIGYLGPEGSFSESAAKIWKDKLCINTEEVEFVASTTIPYLVESIEKGIVDYSVLPLENSIEGNVNMTIDALIQSNIKIVGEVIIKIDHCLAAKKEIGKNGLQVIYSHSQALSQCYHYISEHFPKAKLKAVESTSKAAKIVAQSQENVGAICSKQAAINNNLCILAESIQDYADNKTRFITVGRKNPILGEKNKTTLVIALPENKPGGLYKVLKEFADERIDLTKIESRPTKKELGEYLFFIECVGHVEDLKLAKVLKNLSAQAALLKVLGSYPIAEEG